ncbi:MAG: thioredoxin family protein [Thermodesulfobacterium sp.]|nr:thioredoxin family protein [Thermodesulfobacterium sp.]
MIRQEDLKEINSENVKIFLIKNGGSNERFLQLEEFVNNLKKYLPLRVEIKEEELLAYPALKLTDKEEKVQIYYLAIPEGSEWEPFLNALKSISQNKDFLSENEVKRIKNINKQVEVKIFITPFCPFCPAVVDKANQISIAHNLIKTFIIDATSYPDLVQKYKVTASPTVIINEEYILVGEEAKEKLLEFVEKAGESKYDEEVLKNLLKQAQAERVIELCEKDEECLYSLVELLKSPELFTRIGVMHVLEEMVEKGQNVEKVLPHLIEILHQVEEERDKGDIIYLLGLIGNPEIIFEIEKAVKDEPPLIKEIAEEAIESIKQRQQYH